MELQVIAYDDILHSSDPIIIDKLRIALFETGIVGIRGVPQFEEKSQAYINAARSFSALDDSIKQQYAPTRQSDENEGYELGAEWFKDQNEKWQIDDKKASYYAFITDCQRNKWPLEVELKTPYLALGELIFNTGKHILNCIGLNEAIGINHARLAGYGRMLHYHKVHETLPSNANWCGAHYDHAVFTGLMPAYYFRDGLAVPEPDEAGLFIMPTNNQAFKKINATDKSILLFQVGEFGQLASHDKIRATKHLVRKAKGNIDRFAFAVFFNADDDEVIYSKSELTKDERYAANKSPDGKISFRKWHKASLARYMALSP